MSAKQSNYRWFVVVVFFFFMLLHQTDKLMIGSLQVQISDDFNITNTQWGLVNSGALIVATILYPIWGYLYDHYSRTKLLSLASFVWGATTWLNAIVKSFGGFLVTRASTGIDDSSYPGLYTLIADYFGPNLRGKVYGILQLAQPIGYLVGMILALMVAPAIGGWRSVFYITGSLGLVIAVLIFFGVREMPRGKAEPEFENMTEMQAFKFSWVEAREIFKKKTMWFIFLQGFAGVFPWNVITYFFFAYLEKERGYDANGILFTMAPVILILAAGYFVGGALGDAAFKRTNKGRIIVSSVGVLLGALFMYLAISTPVEAKNQFFILMCLTAIFMPLSSANVIATVYDVTVPEVRSTAQAVEYFVENAGAAFAPILTGLIADMYDLKTAIILICTVAWLLCFFFYLGAIFTIDKDSRDLRKQMEDRANAM
ncbi:MAG: MFS transporter [Anaerolineales bacterium]|jgi:MFS family permease|nr:MFS transporter [Chloroflexota bacterium]MBK6644389.1 MFS transporter [Anaerolineales bacterium]